MACTYPVTARAVFFEMPDKLRRRLIFYFAHSAALYVNKLNQAGLMGAWRNHSARRTPRAPFARAFPRPRCAVQRTSTCTTRRSSRRVSTRCPGTTWTTCRYVRPPRRPLARRATRSHFCDVQDEDYAWPTLAETIEFRSKVRDGEAIAPRPCSRRGAP